MVGINITKYYSGYSTISSKYDNFTNFSRLLVVQFLISIFVIDYINALNDNLPDDLLFETGDAGGLPTSSAASAPTSVVGSIAGGGAGGPPQVVVASTMGMNNGGSALNGITTNCVQTQPMMTSQPQRMPTMPNAPNQNINLVTALQGNPGGPQLQPGRPQLQPGRTYYKLTNLILNSSLANVKTLIR